MKSHLSTLSSVALTAALTASASALASQSTTTMTQEQIKSRLLELCKDLKVGEYKWQKDEVCEVSNDDGITWKPLVWGALLLAITGWALIRFRKRTSVSPPGTPWIPNDTPAPVPGEIDETSSAPGVIVESEETPAELVSEEPDKNPEEIIVERAKTDPRFTFDGDVMKSLTIATMKIDDLTKWSPGVVNMVDPTIAMMVYELLKERIEISGKVSESTPLIITYYTDGTDLDHNVTTSYSPMVAEVYDAHGIPIWYVPGGIVKGYTRITVEVDGTPRVHWWGKYDATTNVLIESYDESGKLLETPAEAPSWVTDILAPDTSTIAPPPSSEVPDTATPGLSPDLPVPVTPVPVWPTPSSLPTTADIWDKITSKIEVLWSPESPVIPADTTVPTDARDLTPAVPGTLTVPAQVVPASPVLPAKSQPEEGVAVVTPPAPAPAAVPIKTDPETAQKVTVKPLWKRLLGR